MYGGCFTGTNSYDRQPLYPGATRTNIVSDDYGPDLDNAVSVVGTAAAWGSIAYPPLRGGLALVSIASTSYGVYNAASEENYYDVGFQLLPEIVGRTYPLTGAVLSTMNTYRSLNPPDSVSMCR